MTEVYQAPAAKKRSKASKEAVLHDSDQRSDQKILLLRAEGGWHYYGLYWALIEIMRAEECLSIFKTSLRGLAFDLQLALPDLEKFLKLCVETGLLREDDEGYRSDWLNDRVAAYQERVHQCSEAGKASAAARAEKKQQETTSPEPSLPAVPVPLDVPSTTVERNNLIRSTPPIQIKESKPNSIQSNSIEQKADPPKTPPDPLEEHLPLALSKLEEPQNQPWTKDSLFVNTGRRPMRSYPSLRFTGSELAFVLRDWVTSGIPGDRFETGFVAAEARAKRIISEGKPPPDAQSWLLGFVKHDLLNGLTQEVRYQRAKGPPKYATGNR